MFNYSLNLVVKKSILYSLNQGFEKLDSSLSIQLPLLFLLTGRINLLIAFTNHFEVNVFNISPRLMMLNFHMKIYCQDPWESRKLFYEC